MDKYAALLKEYRGKLAWRILNDSNEFAPRDTGKLIESSYKASDISGGVLVWDTPYARRQYLGATFRFKKKGATAFWFETAKSKNIEEWKSIVSAYYTRVFEEREKDRLEEEARKKKKN